MPLCIAPLPRAPDIPGRLSRPVSRRTSLHARELACSYRCAYYSSTSCLPLHQRLEPRFPLRTLRQVHRVDSSGGPERHRHVAALRRTLPEPLRLGIGGFVRRIVLQDVAAVDRIPLSAPCVFSPPLIVFADRDQAAENELLYPEAAELQRPTREVHRLDPQPAPGERDGIEPGSAAEVQHRLHASLRPLLSGHPVVLPFRSHVPHGQVPEIRVGRPVEPPDIVRR